MKRTICALMALALCCGAAAGEIALVPAGSFSDYAYFEDDSAFVIDADGDYREGLFDIEGGQVIPCEYEALSGYGVTGYYVAQREEGLNVRGALDAAGNEVIPFQYGDIRFLSERWALGVTLEETSIRPCDYEDYIDGKDYNAVSYDVYDIEGGGYVGFFSYQCQAIRAHGDYLYAQDRDGDTTIYDETLRAVRGGLADPYASFATLDGGVVDLSTGETLLSGFLFGAELGGGLLSVTDGEALGICDTSGRMLTDCVYDRVFAADANGDVRVERDGQFGLVDSAGSEVVPCGYDAIERLSFGGEYVYRVRGYACVEKDGAYNYVLPDGQLSYPVFYKDVDILGLSMILTDIYGQKHILAADGVRTPVDYVEFASFPGGDGTLLKARGADGLWYLIDWHGNLLLPDGYPYAVSLLIAPDGSAVLAEGEDGKTGYIVTR
ncbi:MAG TPA: WG repeat-containing protein [Candidatus Pullichristensenella stercoripullorum]|nr:WG repeat-containing protein [Candidatus Pullichristensenella stercoripullorum]